MSRSKVPRIVSLVYTQNPFYLISACLFVYGLKLLFRAGDSSMLFQRGTVGYMEPWGLMSSFSAVTVLMAVTAILVVRLGKVWEDARSLVLIVLLMLLAISVSLDELLTLLSDRDNAQSHLCFTFVAGITFAVGVCEILIRCLRIRFSAGLRIPLYGFLALFFLWPGLLLTEVTAFSQETTRWLIVCFPTCAGLLTLCLLPVVQRGSATVRDNGTPWNWPLFPWTPFVFIGAAVCFRAYFLTISFDVIRIRGHYWDTIFGVYQLVPFFMAIMVVLLEIGRVEKIVSLQRGVMLCAPLLLLFAYPWLVPWSRLPAYVLFTEAVVGQVASPVFLTLMGLTLMYLWAWRNRVRYAELGFIAMVFLSSCVGPRAFGSRIWELDFTSWPLLTLAIIQIIGGIRRLRSVNLALGLMIAVFVFHMTVRDFPGLHSWHVFLTVHLSLFAVLFVASVLRDEFAQILQELGAPLIWFAALSGIIMLHQRGIGYGSIAGYAVSMMVVSFLLWKLLQNRVYLWVAATQCGLGVLAGIVIGGDAFRTAVLPPGSKHVVMAVVSFAIAVFISALKSGLWRRIRMWRLNRQRTVRTG